MNKILVAALAAVLLSLVHAAPAQSPSTIPRIGFLSSASAEALSFQAFRQALQALGYVEGKNVIIEQRYADFKMDRLPAAANELVALKVDVIVSTATDSSIAAHRATKTIPIVMGGGGDPVAAGLVTSLARPEANITGLATVSPDLGRKRLELLKEICPNNSKIAVIWAPGVGQQLQMKEIEAAAHALRMRLLPVAIQGPDDYERAFAEMNKGGAGCLIVLSGLRGAGVTRNQARIVELAAKSRLPTMYPISAFVDAGGLVSYGINIGEHYRRVSYYVDRILKGAMPGDLPVETPRNFELVINLKTAKQLGLTIPNSVRTQADRVIQ